MTDPSVTFDEDVAAIVRQADDLHHRAVALLDEADRVLARMVVTVERQERYVGPLMALKRRLVDNGGCGLQVVDRVAVNSMLELDSEEREERDVAAIEAVTTIAGRM
jgi:hypothetical protein